MALEKSFPEKLWSPTEIKEWVRIIVAEEIIETILSFPKYPERKDPAIAH